MSCRRIVPVILGAWFSFSLGQNVTGISQNGNIVVVTVSSNTIEIAPYSECIVGVEYKVLGKGEVPNEYLAAGLEPSGTFGSVQIATDPAIITGREWTLKIWKSPLSLEFLDRTGTRLFQTGLNGFTNSAVNAAIVTGDYYGLHNGPSLWLQTPDSSMRIDGRAAGEQGWARSPLAWTPGGFGIYCNKDMPVIDQRAGSLRISNDRGGNLRLFLMAGTPRQVLEGYYRCSGYSPLPPRYAMGFMNSEWKLDETELKGIVGEYRSRKIPLDLYILDYDWWVEGSQPGAYCWDLRNFPSAQSGELKKWCDVRGLKMMGIRKPWFDQNGNRTHLNFFDTAQQNSYWRNFISEPCNPYERGITSYWNDEADHGDQNLGMQKGQYLGQRAYNDKRIWSLNRCYQGGAHKYAYGHWSGDIYSNWTAFAHQRKHMLSSINLGCAWWAQDIGGFHGRPSNELYVRWMQMGAFTPIYRVHGSQYEQRQPWSYGAQAEAICREFINLRYRLLPYINNSFYRLRSEGLPPVRPLVMDYSSDPNTADYVGGWMFGDDILASPVFTAGATTKRHYLPSGAWYDFWTGGRQEGGQWITSPAPLDRIPVFVKAGAIIPMGRIKQHVAESVDDTIEVRVYPGADGEMILYEDDDSTYAYEKGAFTRIGMTWKDASGTLMIGSRTGGFPEMLNSRVFTVVFVSGTHGSGIPVTASPDQKVVYTGTPVTVTRSGVGAVSRPLTGIQTSIQAISGRNHVLLQWSAPADHSIIVTAPSGRILRRVTGASGRHRMVLATPDVSSGAYVAAVLSGKAVKQIRFTVR